MSDENKAIEALYAEALRIRVSAGPRRPSSAPNTASPTAVPPVAGPAPLRVFATVRRAYGSVISEIAEFGRRSWLFIAIIVALFALMKRNFASDPGLPPYFVALNLVAYASLFTCWVRRHSGLPPGGFAALHLRCGLRELKVLGVLLLGLVPSTIAFGIVFAAANSAIGELAGLLGGILVFALIYVRGPLMMAVAIAQDRFQSIDQTWKRGRGRMWKSVAIAVLTLLPVTFACMVLRSLLGGHATTEGAVFGFAAELTVRLAGMAILAVALQEIDSSA
ncbi:hypothetical protein [Azospirillum sp. TSH100]|nr:hypothetical protein [Azospirillum sp. TSH100]